jgi:hypothetical protein
MLSGSHMTAEARQIELKLAFADSRHFRFYFEGVKLGIWLGILRLSKADTSNLRT